MKCPYCKSENVGLYMGFQFGKYECGKCGYIGPLVIEEDENENIKPIKHSKGKC